MTTSLAWKSALPSRAAGEFEARIYRVDSEPDADGDIIARGAVVDGHGVRVSSFDIEHGSLLGLSQPVGKAKLFHIGSSVHALGEIDDTPDGRKFKRTLQQFGPDVQWSIGWLKSSVKAREPTPAELARCPDAKQVIERWAPEEIGPVQFGACGPSCRLLGVKCAGGCSCNGRKQAPGPRPHYLTKGEWIAPYDEERAAKRALAAGVKKWAIREAPTVRFFKATPTGRPVAQLLHDRNEVWIQIGLGVEQAAASALHELRHVWQREHGIPTDRWSEGDAEGYATVLARDLFRAGAL